MERAVPRRRNLHPLGRIPGGMPALRPGFIEPCLATLRERSPAGDQWIHELKYEGARTQAHLIDGKPLLYSAKASPARRHSPRSRRRCRCSRRARPFSMAKSSCWTSAVLRISRAPARHRRGPHRSIRLLRIRPAVSRWRRLRSVPLIERKRLLAHVLSALPMQRVRVASHIEADGPAVFERACEMQIAGIVSRKRESAYREGVQDTWVEARCVKHLPRTRDDAGSLITRRVVAPSKEQLATYWARVARRALKYLARRPLELVRDLRAHYRCCLNRCTVAAEGIPR